jgi:hypothetical protein
MHKVENTSIQKNYQTFLINYFFHHTEQKPSIQVAWSDS